MCKWVWTDQLDGPAKQTSWTDQLNRLAGRTSRTDQLDGPAGRTSWTDQLVGPAGWTSSLYLKPWPVRIFEDWPFSLYIVTASKSNEGLVLLGEKLKNFNFPPNKTRPSLDLEAATMYKLKGQSSNLQTGQSFKEENWSVRLAYPSSGFFLLALLKSFSMNLTTLTIL